MNIQIFFVSMFLFISTTFKGSLVRIEGFKVVEHTHEYTEFICKTIKKRSHKVLGRYVKGGV